MEREQNIDLIEELNIVTLHVQRKYANSIMLINIGQ